MVPRALIHGAPLCIPSSGLPGAVSVHLCTPPECLLRAQEGGLMLWEGRAQPRPSRVKWLTGDQNSGTLDSKAIFSLVASQWDVILQPSMAPRLSA